MSFPSATEAGTLTAVTAREGAARPRQKGVDRGTVHT